MMGLIQMKWNDWCFRPWFCTARLYWAAAILGEWDEFCYEYCPWCRIDRSICWPVVQHYHCTMDALMGLMQCPYSWYIFTSLDKQENVKLHSVLGWVTSLNYHFTIVSVNIQWFIIFPVWIKDNIACYDSYSMVYLWHRQNLQCMYIYADILIFHIPRAS